MTPGDVVELYSPTIVPIILCGGKGTRLWPVSKDNKPKQLLPIVNKTILLHDTLERVQSSIPEDLKHTVIVTTQHLEKETTRQLQNFNEECANHILCEPCSKNTAAAVAYATLYAKKVFGENAILWILPADHYVEDQDELRSLIQNSYQHLPSDKILTFGVQPTYPATEYGYIEYKPSSQNAIADIVKFVEKPNQEDATSYIDTERYYWNSGMFMAHAKTIINEFIEHAPHIISALSENIPTADAYQKIKSISFDHAIMEKSQNVTVTEANIGWSDVGSWHNIWKIKDKDAHGNVTHGNVIADGSKNCLIQSENLTIAALGLNDIAIIEDGHSLLIANKQDSQSIKKIKTLLAHRDDNTQQEKLCVKHNEYLVKEITLDQGEAIPLHYHRNRSEQWTVLSGTAHITIDNEELDYEVGAIIHMPLTVPHAVKNKSKTPLKILEIQFGVDNSPFDIIYLDETSNRQLGTS